MRQRAETRTAESDEEEARERRAGGILYRPREAIGPHGPIFTEFRHDAKGAVAKLREIQDGEAVAALHHPDVGDIDLIWGEAGTTAGRGYGLAKIVRWHPEVLEDLQGILAGLSKDQVRSTDQTVQLDDPNYHAVVRRNWKGQPKTWLLTQFEKRKPSPAGRTMDISGTPRARRDDTAPPPSGGIRSAEAGASSIAPSEQPSNRKSCRGFHPVRSQGPTEKGWPKPTPSSSCHQEQAALPVADPNASNLLYTLLPEDSRGRAGMHFSFARQRNGRSRIADIRNAAD